ncbi:MAG TPA: biotin/lipoyl-containing protein, partial [Rhodanobacteraceae bacterium]|nr:biotin/lipoyl-containing protein [Rhodanobacteraceae bacterium]
MSIEVKVPVLPESVSDATIATWHKKPGDTVKRDENLVDLETDKVVLEVPAPADGVLKEIRHAAGDTVNSEDVIATLEEGAAAATSGAGKIEEKPAQSDSQKREAKKAEEDVRPAMSKEAEAKAKAAEKGSAAADELSPAGRRVAVEEKIDPAQVAGTGRGGRVTKEDLVNYSKGGKPAAAPAPTA